MGTKTVSAVYIYRPQNIGNDGTHLTYKDCRFVRKMSSIFDHVEFATSRRKNKVMDTRQSKGIFGGQGPGVVSISMPSTSAPTPAVAPSAAISTTFYSNSIPITERVTDLPFSTQSSSSLGGGLAASPLLASHKFSPYNMPSSVKIDVVWTICVACSLFPLFASVYAVLVAPGFSVGMLTIPYQCNLFYFGLFCGLPGITVHIFCLSLIFHQLCRSGVILSLLSTFLMIVGIEHACMAVPSISTDYTFYLMAISVCCGLIAQGFFVSILYNESKQKQLYIGILGVAFVLVTLSVLSIVLSVLNSETPHTKPTALVRILPLSAATIIYALSTYWTLFPVRVVCNNM